MVIRFIIANGANPVPYKRTTQKQKWVDKEYRRYQTYKDEIYAEFIKATGKLPHQIFQDKTKYYVNVMAYYKDKTHADTDNVAKGVNDAIFQKPLSDKYVAGFYDYDYDKENPRLEITIKKA
jgi:hypothetical protein